MNRCVLWADNAHPPPDIVRNLAQGSDIECRKVVWPLDLKGCRELGKALLESGVYYMIIGTWPPQAYEVWADYLYTTGPGHTPPCGVQAPVYEDGGIKRLARII
jgi:hypothetical protein